MNNDINQIVYPEIETMTLGGLKTFFNTNIKDRKYTFLVIGNRDLVDHNALKKLGDYQELTLEEIFGY